MAFTALDDGKPVDQAVVAAFKSHVIHPVLATVGEMRPSVDISVQ